MTDGTVVRWIPGHGPPLQMSLSKGVPSHVFPPFCGVGLVHVRSRIIDPVPQVTEQVVDPAQADQPPSTGDKADPEIDILLRVRDKTSYPSGPWATLGG